MRAFVLLCLLQSACGGHPWASLAENQQTRHMCEELVSCDCCLMLRQVGHMSAHFNATLNQLQGEYARTLQKLHGTVANRTAFSVALHNGHFRCLGPNAADSIIVYKHVFLNLGLDYDVDSGVFVARHSGYYTFALTIHSDAGAEGSLLAACAKLYVNNQVRASLSEQNDQDQEDAATNVVVLELRAQDTVSVHLPAGCFLCDDSNHFNTFSGFLVYTTD